MAAAGPLHVDVDLDAAAGPDRIRPDRWLEMETQPSPYSYLAFNAGKPHCCRNTAAHL
jgi:cytochrome P450